MEESLILRGIWKAMGATQVLRDFSAGFPLGKTTCILGPSGCGKTTLLRIVAQLLKPDRGTVAGIENQRISFVFQEDRLLPWKTAAENIGLVLRHAPHGGSLEHIVQDNLDLVQMGAYGSYYPHQLSGGMRQRVAFARAFSYPSDVILLDEPFKGLDVHLKGRLMENIEGILRRDTRTAIYVTHDPEEAVLFGNQIMIMSDKPAHIKELLVFDQEARHGPDKEKLVRLVTDKLRPAGGDAI